jgi:hypothetical protein
LGGKAIREVEFTAAPPTGSQLGGQVVQEKRQTSEERFPTMATKKTPEPDIFTAAAQAIGSTLGKLAVAAGIEHPGAPIAKKKAPALKKKAPTKRATPKKAAIKKAISKQREKKKSAK